MTDRLLELAERIEGTNSSLERSKLVWLIREAIVLLLRAKAQEHKYPTEDAYMRACRALHWRTAQLRAHGIEPITLTDEMSHYPPEDYNFSQQPKGE